MDVEIVLDQNDGAGVDEMDIGQVFQDMSVVHGGMAIGDFDVAPAKKCWAMWYGEELTLVKGAAVTALLVAAAWPERASSMLSVLQWFAPRTVVSRSSQNATLLVCYTTLFCFSSPISSLVNPNSANTSSVCSPNSGGWATILLGVRDNVTGWPTRRM